MKKALCSLLSVISCTSCPSTQTSLVEVKKLIPDVIIDLHYATPHNFVQRQVYPSQAKCYLVEPAAEALKAAAKEFKKKGYTIKVWDGYRPQSVQYTMWKLIKVPEQDKELYVANPQKGSRHNRGCAVDITLVDSKGNELDMGTKLDDFSEKAHRDYKNLSSEVVENRKLLQKVMEKHGFKGLPTEWWHFDYKGWEKYPLLDIPLDAVEK